MTEYSTVSAPENTKSNIPASWAGCAVGLFLGYISVTFGVFAMIIVAIFGAVGYAIAGFLSGQLDIVDAMVRMQQRRRLY